MNGKPVDAQGAGLVFKNIGIKETRIFSEAAKNLATTHGAANTEHSAWWLVARMKCENKDA